MALDQRFSAVPKGHIAAIVTVLEMRAPAALRPEHPRPGRELRAIATPDADFYLDLYRRVGAPHLWYSRLTMERSVLERTLADPEIVFHALFENGTAEGILELDFRRKGACEIVYFGVTPALSGTGAARLMMNRAIATAFARPIDRLWLHTNNLDHREALDFYRRSGFTPAERRIEMAPDPRLSGLLPRDAAPEIPIL